MSLCCPPANLQQNDQNMERFHIVDFYTTNCDKILPSVGGILVMHFFWTPCQNVMESFNPAACKNALPAFQSSGVNRTDHDARLHHTNPTNSTSKHILWFCLIAATCHYSENHSTVSYIYWEICPYQAAAVLHARSIGPFVSRSIRQNGILHLLPKYADKGISTS